MRYISLETINTKRKYKILHHWWLPIIHSIFNLNNQVNIQTEVLIGRFCTDFFIAPGCIPHTAGKTWGTWSESERKYLNGNTVSSHYVSINMFPFSTFPVLRLDTPFTSHFPPRKYKLFNFLEWLYHDSPLLIIIHTKTDINVICIDIIINVTNMEPPLLCTDWYYKLGAIVSIIHLKKYFFKGFKL